MDIAFMQPYWLLCSIAGYYCTCYFVAEVKPGFSPTSTRVPPITNRRGVNYACISDQEMLTACIHEHHPQTLSRCFEYMYSPVQIEPQMNG